MLKSSNKSLLHTMFFRMTKLRKITTLQGRATFRIKLLITMLVAASSMAIASRLTITRPGKEKLKVDIKTGRELRRTTVTTTISMMISALDTLVTGNHSSNARIENQERIRRSMSTMLNAINLINISRGITLINERCHESRLDGRFWQV